MAYVLPYAGIYIEYLEPNRPPQWLPQVSLSSATKLHHTASRTLLTQTFINSTRSQIPSAKYNFPLYESCAIVAFRCYIGKRLIEGIIKEKEDASATFQAAVERNEPASLLEQHTTDVFSTSIGNIPAGETIKVEIEYIMELKHDAEVDGLRFTIPTSIAPRYGTPPIGLTADARSAVTAKNMNISVEISMSSSIQSVQSPSHPITLHLGGHSTETPDDAFNPQHALATLGQTTTELGNDFILMIKCASLSSPTALLEVHPKIPNSKALMVTLVPKFNLPKSTKPEVVFIVDRSGSMSSRVTPLKSSLSVFLKSLPLDVNFNICSFGSRHSFLWDKSRPYSSQSFAEAQKYCDRIKADFGGTELLPAIKSTIEKRLKDLNLEIMVLTDGEVWNTEDLFEYVEKQTEKGDVRLFSLGIGQDVSHSLIDGLARVGRGFSQVVSNEREGMESKVARMLRGGLSAHVVNYRLEWEGKPSVDVVKKKKKSPIGRAIRQISLFDSRANTDAPTTFSDSTDFIIPSAIQAPYKVQPLFPFSRTTAYVILSSDTRPPSHVWLRGTTPEGDELELEIAVQAVPVKGETIHQLAARKILQELKDGTSYVHGGVDKEKQPGLLAEWVKKEGVRVGLKYGVASHWTSFVAVERKADEEEKVDEKKVDEEMMDGVEEETVDQQMVDSPPPPSELNDDDDDDWDTVLDARRDNDDDDDDVLSPRSLPGPQVMGGGGRGSASVPVMMMRAPQPPPIPYPTRKHLSASYKQSNTPMKSPAYGKSFLASMPPSSELSLDKPGGSVNPLSISPSSLMAQPLISNNLTGKAPERESDKSIMGLRQQQQLQHQQTRMQNQQGMIPPAAQALSAPDPYYISNYLPPLSHHSSPSYSSPSPSYSPPSPSYSPPSPSSSLPQSQYSSNLSDTSTFSSPLPPPPGPPGGATRRGLFGTMSSLGAIKTKSRGASQYSATSSSSAFSAPLPPPSGPVAGADTGSKFGAFSSLVPNKTGMAPSPGAVLNSQEEYSSTPLRQEGYERSREKRGGSSSLLWKHQQTKSSTGIGISYSPISAPPKERLSADTGVTQPLSSKTKSLIDLQTFEGSFMLDSALASLLGVSISVLEARLISFLPSNAGLSLENRKKVWATVLAIKLFERQLLGEKSVWQLVADKARVWMAGVEGVEFEDVIQLEKMAGELGVF